jgi:predicted dehydrogenase
MRVGLLGLGFMGSTHLQAMEGIPDAELGAVMDANEVRLTGDLSDIQGNLGIPGKRMDLAGAKRYRTVDEILADPDVEAVDVCLPTFLHASIAMQALAAGKHVLVEKPMALDGATADQMTEAAVRHGKILMTAHVLRFFPAYQVLAELVRSGRLGGIRSALFRRRTAVPTWGPWEFDKTKSGGGVFDLLIHDADMCLHLFGTPQAVSATGYEDLRGGVDTLTAELHYSDIRSVTITGGWHHTGEYPFSMEYTVIAEHGVVEFSSDGRPPTVYWADGKKEPLSAGESDAYQAEIEYFLSCCRNNSQPETCPPAESANAVKLTKLMTEARACRGDKVACSF